MIYAIVAGQEADALGEVIRTQYPDHHQFPPSCWFVVDALSAEDISRKLGIANGAIRGVQAVVIPVTSYYGYAPGDLWTWLQKRWPG